MNPRDPALKPIQTQEEDLKDGDWVYTPNQVFTTHEPNNIFQYDSRINYSQSFGDGLVFYKIERPKNKIDK